MKHVITPFDCGVERREFLKGMLAATGLCSLGSAERLFAAPEGWSAPGTPELVFGVLSDTHLRTSHNGRTPGKNWSTAYFKAALEFFRDAGVDAVMHCGDFAHRGQVAEMQFHADVWKKVFARRPAPVKLFATGNHDVIGATYGDFVKKLYPDEAEMAKHVFANDIAGHWERIWGEKYEGVWHREVKGYHFFGRHYEMPVASLQEMVLANAEKFGLRGDRPFFIVQHRIPPKAQRDALRGFPNAMAFFGHWHISNADWRTVVFNKFPMIQCGACRPAGDNCLLDRGVAKAPLQGKEGWAPSREGLVVKVYRDMVVIERREFGTSGGAKTGADWVMPLGKRSPHPLSSEELKKSIGEPQFRADAKLELSLSSCLRVKIPLADGNPDSRAYAFEVAVAGEEGKSFKGVYARGCNLAPGKEPNGGVTTLDIPVGELPGGESIAVSVRPLTSLGTAGRPIAARFNKQGETKEKEHEYHA